VRFATATAALPRNTAPAAVWDRSGWLAWIAGFVTMSAQASTPVLGSTAVLIFLGVWFAYAVPAPFQVVRLLSGAGLIWLFPLLALLSVLWSSHPDISQRYGTQYVLTAGIAILMAKRLSPRQMVSMLMAATLLVCMLSVLFGRYDEDSLTGNRVFVGLFASKNQLAFFVMLLALAAAAVAVDRLQPVLLRLLSLPALALVPPLLVLTQSGTSRVTAVLAVALFFGAMVFLRLRPVERAFAVLLVTVPLLPLTVFLLSGPGGELAARFVEDVLGKDLTLTGRTTLWAVAATVIERQPWLGVGFSAFWVQGNVEAEGLWRMAHVASRMGFHFHNTLYETGVQLGYVGVGVLLAMFGTALSRLLRWSNRDPSPPALFFLSLMVVMMVRAMVEVEILATFQVSTVLAFAIIAYAQNAARGGNGDSRPE